MTITQGDMSTASTLRAALGRDAPVVLSDVIVPQALLSGLSGNPAPGAAAPGLQVVDIGISDGRFCQAEELDPALRLSAAGWTVLPGLADAHVHLDKTYTVSETGMADGTLMGAIRAFGQASGGWPQSHYDRKMRRAISEAAAAGTRHLRSHIDCPDLPDQMPGWRAARELQDDGDVRLQLCALAALSRVEDANFQERCRQVAAVGGVLGAFVAPGESDPNMFEDILRQADAHGLDVDFHIDEGLLPGPASIPALAQAVLDTGFGGRVLAGHGCALTFQPEAERARALDKIAEAGIAVASLPRSNLFLQDRSPDRTPVQRGITIVHEMRARGIPVMFGADNVGDVFYPLGDYDPLRLFADAMCIAHLDQDPGHWIDAIAGIPAHAMGIKDGGRITPGVCADGVLVPATDWPSLLSAPVADRIVLRAGKPRGAPDHVTELTQQGGLQ